MHIGVLTLRLHLPACHSLKEKRGRLKPLLHQLRREFNLSVAEIDAQDTWQRAVIACAVVSNDAAQAQRVLQKAHRWVETTWREGWVEDEEIVIW